MAISVRLTRTLRHRLGDGAADDLVNWMGRMESNRSELRETMDHYMARTNSLCAEYQARMDSRFAEQQARTDVGLAQVKGELSAIIERRFSDLLKWSFVFWCGTLGAMAALIQL